VRPEANFESLDALVARIHADADVTRAALKDPVLAALKHDDFLRPAESHGSTGQQAAQEQTLQSV